MPHWNAAGEEEWVCQQGAHICTGPSTWIDGVGNVCPAHLADAQRKLPRGKINQKKQRPEPLHEYCRKESGGLTGQALNNYINRYYGLS